MDAYYFDTSALVKWYVVEAGTAWVTSILSPENANEVYTVRITGAEVIAAFSLRLRTGTLTPADAHVAITQFKADFRGEFQLVDVTEGVVDTAMTLAERHGLRRPAPGRRRAGGDAARGDESDRSHESWLRTQGPWLTIQG